MGRTATVATDRVRPLPFMDRYGLWMEHRVRWLARGALVTRYGNIQRPKQSRTAPCEGKPKQTQNCKILKVTTLASQPMDCAYQEDNHAND